MSNYQTNNFNTTDLVLSVMSTVAFRLGLDINDDEVSNKLYWICCDLESWGDCGFGSSDHYTYVKQARLEFNIAEVA